MDVMTQEQQEKKSKCNHPTSERVKYGIDLRGRQKYFCKKCRRFFRK